MEMTYGGALVMPSSYAMMDEEEMMYLEGGAIYRGSKALNELTNMAATIFGYACTCVVLAKVMGTAVAASVTGIGIVIAIGTAIGAAIGISYSLFMATESLVYFGFAAMYYVKYNAFEMEKETTFGCTRYTYVGRAY